MPGIVEVKDIPKRRSGTRKSKFPFTPEQVTQARKQLKAAGRVGCGPYDSTEGKLRNGRAAATRLKNLVCEDGDPAPEAVGTTAFEDDKGEWGVLRLK